MGNSIIAGMHMVGQVLQGTMPEVFFHIDNSMYTAIWNYIVWLS